jgi:hypothetical protein
MIHLACVTAVCNVITELQLPNFYTYYFQSPNILYSCSNQSFASIEYVTCYCQITLHLTVICMNSMSYECCKFPDVTILRLTVTKFLKAPAVCFQSREINSQGEGRFIIIPTNAHICSTKLNFYS